jgi:hypothetical protein
VDRRAELSAVRKVINENLPDGYEESICSASLSLNSVKERGSHELYALNYQLSTSELHP